MPVVSQAWPGNEALDRGASPDLASSASFTGSVRMAAGTIVIADSERHCRASSLPFARLIFQCNGLRPVGRRVRVQYAPTNALRNLDLIVAPSYEYSSLRCVQGRFHAHGESVAVASVKGMRSHHCYRDLSPLQSCICSRIYVLPDHRHSNNLWPYRALASVAYGRRPGVITPLW